MIKENIDNIVIEKAKELLDSSEFPYHVYIKAIATALHLSRREVKSILDRGGYPIHKTGIDSGFDYITRKN